MPKARFLSIPVLAVAGLIGLAGCGGGSSSTTPPPNPNPSSNGLNIYPPTASVPVGGIVDFTGYVPSNATATVTWAVTGSSNGSITSAGVYTAPASVPSPAQVSVTASSSGFSATAVVTITAAQGVGVNPAAASVAAGSKTAFTASTNGSPVTTGVTWEVNGTAGGDGVHGTIDANGNYTAPLTPPPGGSTVITATVSGASGNSTVTVVYSNASFSGPYAVSYTGDDGSGYLAVVGNITANSTAATVTGIEDLLSAGNALSSNQSINGTFLIGPDGRGAVTLNTGEVWQIALSSNQHALLVNFNTSATGSGTIDAETTTTPPLAAGHYVFQLGGLDANGNSFGIAGAFTSDGNGALAATGNVIDINDAGSAGSNTLNTTDDTTLAGVFVPSVGAPAPGSLTLTANDLANTVIVRTNTGSSLSFDFYIVSPSHIHLIETDGNAFLTGDVYAEPAPGNVGYTADLLLAGGYAFTLGGATTNGPYAAGGVLLSSGGSSTTSTSGSTTGGVFDNNAPGFQSQSDATLKSGSYSVDATTGRITLSSIGTNQSSGSFDLVAYVAAPDPANPNSPVPVLLLETDANVIATGTAFVQSAVTTPSGSFATNLTGVGTSTQSEQDIGAALNINGTTISGTMDINNFEVNGQFLGINISSGSLLSVDSNGRGTATIKAADGATFQLAYYDVNPNTVVMIDTDGTRVATGILLKQF